MNEKLLIALGVVMASAVRGQIRIAGMEAENQHRMSRGEALAYTDEQFSQVIYDEKLDANSVMNYLRSQD